MNNQYYKEYQYHSVDNDTNINKINIWNETQKIYVFNYRKMFVYSSYSCGPLDKLLSM